jgi:hypothetical protein
VRFVLLLWVLTSSAWAAPAGDAVLAAFSCAALTASRAQETAPSRFVFDFVPDHDPDTVSDPVFAAMEWVTGLAFKGIGANVFVKTGTPREMARYFYLMAEQTDQGAAAILGGFVVPVESPARHLQIDMQCLFSGVCDLQPEFGTVELAARAPAWERAFLSKGIRLSREMGILVTHEGEQVRVAFLFPDPPR